MSQSTLSLNTLSKFHVNDGGNTMAILRQVYSYRLQHVIQEFDFGTIQYLGPVHIVGRYPCFYWQIHITSLRSEGFVECSMLTHLFTLGKMYYSIFKIILINGDSPRTC